MRACVVWEHDLAGKRREEKEIASGWVGGRQGGGSRESRKRRGAVAQSV